ncbi:hypothetical protein KBA27_06115 [bacterium]|nr:hypothetical protein [bacterium]
MTKFFVTPQLSYVPKYATDVIKTAKNATSELFKDCKALKDFYYDKDSMLCMRDGFSLYGAKEPEIYTGSYLKSVGKSTEFEYGGGFLIGDMKQPLSTAGIHDCAVLNLVNEKTGKQMMYHVFAETEEPSISKLITEKFPEYTGVNILPGDNRKTSDTVERILNVLKTKNGEAPVKFYVLPSKNAEIISCDGELKTIYHQGEPKPTFEVVSDKSSYNY